MSVVVPMYQAERTIGATLASLRAQERRDIEIVVVDDGSSDSGPALVRAACLEDDRIRLVAQANRGLAGARNTGIREARSAVIGFCDADDTWSPGKADAHLRLLATSATVGLTFSGSWIMTLDGTPTGVVRAAPDGVVTPDEMLLRNPVGNGSSAIVRRACLDDVAFRGADGEVQWFDESYRQCEDIQLWMRVVLSRWTVRGVPTPLVGYRVGGASLSSNLDRQAHAWERMLSGIAAAHPAIVARSGNRARAIMLGWLSRKAVLGLDGRQALRYVAKALRSHPRLILEDPARILFALASALALALLPASAARSLRGLGIAAFSRLKVPSPARRMPSAGALAATVPAEL